MKPDVALKALPTLEAVCILRTPYFAPNLTSEYRTWMTRIPWLERWRYEQCHTYMFGNLAKPTYHLRNNFFEIRIPLFEKQPRSALRNYTTMTDNLLRVQI